MAIPQTIQELANKVRTAVFGKEVRESIAKSMEETGNTADETRTKQEILQQQFDDAVYNATLIDPSSVELVAAQTNTETGENFTSIGYRLDEENKRVTTLLAELETKKADQFYVETMLATAVSGAPKSFFNTLTALEEAYPQGTDGIFLVLENGHIYIWNNSAWEDAGLYQSEGIGDGSVGASKTTFLKEISLQLFDKTKTTTGLVVKSTGAIDPSYTGYQASDFMMLEDGVTYHTTKAYDLAYYDANKTHISGSGKSPGGLEYDLILPTNGRYVRITYSNTDLDTTFVSEKGRPYKIDIIDNEFKNTLNKHVDEYLLPLTPDRLIEPTLVPQPIEDGNMFNKATITRYKYVNNDGSLGDSSFSVFCSDYILVKPNTNYTFYKTLQYPGAWFDESMNFISKLSPSSDNPVTIESPSNAKYLKWNGDATTDPNTIMIVEGTVYPAGYIAYVSPKNKYYFDWLYVDNTSKSKWNNKDIIWFGDSIVWYDGKTYPSGVVCKGYLSNLNDEIGFSSMTNKGVSGASIAVDAASYVDVITKVLEVTDFSPYDLCLIAAGTNDLFNNVPLGTYGGFNDTEFDTSTFYGAYRKIITHILTLKPTIQLALFTPLHRNASGYHIDTTNGQGHKLSDYVEAIKIIGKNNGIPVLDLYSISGVNKLTLNTYTIDGLHLNNLGYEYVTKNKIVPFLETI